MQRAVAPMDEKGRILLPDLVIQHLGLIPGDRLSFRFDTEDVLILRRKPRKGPSPTRRLAVR